MKATLKIDFGPVEDEGEKNYVDLLDDQIKAKFLTTPVELPDGLTIGDEINLKQVAPADLSSDEVEQLSGWAVISKVTGIVETDNGQPVVEVLLFDEEVW
jgi:hypothetical protein